MNKHVASHWIHTLGVMFLLAVAAGLTGCGGGGSSTPPADPTGYYGVTGFATVKQSDNTTDLNITSGLEAMVSNNRILMLSPADKLLYDIKITNINGNSFTGTAVIYTDNQNPMNATVSGTITSGSSISGTLTGTGAGNGTFKLVYESQGISPLSNIGWGVVFDNSSRYFIVQVDNAWNLTTTLVELDGYFSGCSMSGTLSVLGSSNLYRVTSTISGCTSDTSFNGDYTGFATQQNAIGTILVMAVTKADGSHSISADFSQ